MTSSFGLTKALVTIARDAAAPQVRKIYLPCVEALYVLFRYSAIASLTSKFPGETVYPCIFTESSSVNSLTNVSLTIFGVGIEGLPILKSKTLCSPITFFLSRPYV